MDNLINQFNEERVCAYKEEVYSVRDNGAVMRHGLCNGKSRKLDNTWTFGKKNVKTGYMMFSNHRVHIIVATAFYGAHDSTRLVVDHIDTNRCNNRIENLRWVTRLENALLNPITRKRIEYLCGGDIENFIKNPSCLRIAAGTYQDVSWMRTVSADEAKNAYSRVMAWVNEKSRKIVSADRKNVIRDREFAYKGNYKNALGLELSNDMVLVQPDSCEQQLTNSLTPLAKQRFWVTPTEFPFCPSPDETQSLEKYAMKIKKGEIVSRNWHSKFRADEFEIFEDKLYIRAHDEGAVKPYSLVIISFEDDFYVHQGSTFFTEDGAKKAFELSVGREWTGGEVLDDYC